jgi:tetratricopeptide (TPR) repeat protein
VTNATAQSRVEEARLLEDAVAAISAGRLPQAESALNSLLSRSPNDPDALNLLGVVRAQQQLPDEAEKLFLRAITAAPKHLSAHINLGELYFTTSKTQQALQTLLVAHRLSPTRPDVNLRLGAIYEGRREFLQSLEYLRLIPRAAASSDYYQLMIKVALGLNRKSEAQELAIEFKDARIDDDETRAQIALLLGGAGLSNVALEVLNDSQTRSFPLLYALGVIKESVKNYEQAEIYLTEALGKNPDDVPTLRAIARVERARGQFEKALAHLVQARRLAPALPVVLYDFGVTALQMDLYLDALPVFELLHRQLPREPAYTYALAAARLRNGEKVEAIDLLKSYLAARPQDPAGFYLLGAALRDLKQFAEARVALEQSLKLYADADAEYLLGLTLNEMANHEASVAALKRAVNLQPRHAGAHTALGTAYREQGDYTRARAMLERAIELNPKDLRAHYQLGLVYAKLGDKSAAEKMLTRADELRSEQRQQETVVLKLVEAP